MTPRPGTLAAHHLWVHGYIKVARRLIRKAQRLVPGHRLADTAEVSPGPERAENGTGSVGAIGHTAGNEGRTP